MDIKFVLANIDDIEKLIVVQNKSFYDDYISYGECPSYNEAEQKILEFIQSENEIVYKIIKDREIIGDIIIRRRENNRYYLRTISVLPKYQGLGIGQMALKYIEEIHPEAVEWELITPFKSYRNHHVYEKIGYVKVEEYKNSDVLIMFRYKKEIIKNKQGEIS